MVDVNEYDNRNYNYNNSIKYINYDKRRIKKIMVLVRLF